LGNGELILYLHPARGNTFFRILEKQAGRNKIKNYFIKGLPERKR